MLHAVRSPRALLAIAALSFGLPKLLVDGSSGQARGWHLYCRCHRRPTTHHHPTQLAGGWLQPGTMVWPAIADRPRVRPPLHLCVARLVSAHHPSIHGAR